MKNKKLLVLVIILALFLSSKTYAQDICSKSGYTILTINGIFTDNIGAKENKENLKKRLSASYNSEPIIVDYVYNATHLAGALDLVDAVRQGLFDSKSDYDLVEILDSASDKVTTQKILLVGHSQGNFYANSFYNKVSDREGGVPAQSIGVYSVATPDDHVAGGGKYLTSDTDSAIAAIVGRLKKIMTPNTHIELQKVDGAGHDFSNVYLKYRSAQIVSDIKSSFNNLETNSIQNEKVACLSPQKISILHDFTGTILAIADFTINTGVKVSSIANKTASSLANTLVKIAKGGLAAVGFADNKEITPIIAEAIDTEIIQENNIVTMIDLPEKENPENITNTEFINIEKEENILPIETIEANVLVESVHHSHNNSNNNEEEIIPEIIPEVVIPEIIIPKIATSGIIIPEIIVPNVATSEIIIPEIIVPHVATSEIIIPDTTAPVVTLLGANLLYLSLEKDLPYVESGATAIDEKDGNVEVIVSGKIDRYIKTMQTLTYTATDKAGNSSFKTRDIKVSDRVYIAKNTFGTGNGDGHDWKAWFFDGSTVYNWSDTYVNKYLHEEFTIETQSNSLWCAGCLMRGIFKDDPRKGFDVWDFNVSALENNPQSNHTGRTYEVSIQWDSTGYRTIISHGSTVDTDVHINITNMNNDLWVGWDPMVYAFKTFPTGSWWGLNNWSETVIEGGHAMTLTPFPVYDENAEDIIPVVEEYVVPSIIDFDVNSLKDHLTLNPALDHPTISLVANKNVNWLTIKIEKISNNTIYKTLQSNSDTCVDGTSVCTKVWEGDLSSGGLLQNGDYKIRVRIKDIKDSKDFTEIEYEEYLPIILTVEGGV